VSTKRAVAETVFLVSIFFPIVYLLEIESPTFFVPVIEESLCRLFPLMITLYSYRDVDAPYVGFVAGVTFGMLEIFVKIIHFGGFSVLMLVPVLLVHIPNATIQSVVIDFSYDTRRYSLIPVAFIVCVLWHWMYNAYLYVV